LDADIPKPDSAIDRGQSIKSRQATVPW